MENKSFQNGFSAIVVIVLLIVAGGGILAWKQGWIPKVLESKATPTPTPILSYIACGCGCCGGVEPTTTCLYHLKGEDMQKLIAADKTQKESPTCPTVGCSQPIKYIYCD